MYFKRKNYTFITLAFLAVSLGMSGCASIGPLFKTDYYSSSSSGPSYLVGAIPDRPDDAMTGSNFLRQIEHTTYEEREAAILREIRHGNIPDFMRKLKPIHVTLTTSDNKKHEGTIWVMPDYLAIGSNSDFIRVPMTPLTAQRIADHFGFMLPTKKMVDAIYEQAQVKLPPVAFHAGPKMRSNEFIADHNMRIQQQLDSVSHRNALIAGIKKDIVITNRLVRQPRRVAIYGWHRQVNDPIQPLSLVHNNHYADYSHGVRLVAGTMVFDGIEIPTAEVLSSDRFAHMLSDEGALMVSRVLTDY